MRWRRRRWRIQCLSLMRTSSAPRCSATRRLPRVRCDHFVSRDARDSIPSVPLGYRVAANISSLAFARLGGVASRSLGSGRALRPYVYINILCSRYALRYLCSDEMRNAPEPSEARRPHQTERSEATPPNRANAKTERSGGNGVSSIARDEMTAATRKLSGAEGMESRASRETK